MSVTASDLHHLQCNCVRGVSGIARPLRVNVAGGWYYVVSREYGGDRIYRDDIDRRRFLGLVSELPGRFSVEIHEFVLMDNITTCCFGAGRPA